MTKRRNGWFALPAMLLQLALLAACATAPVLVEQAASTYAQPAPEALVEPWLGPVEEIETTEERILYRAYGGGASRLGAWMAETAPESAASVRAAMALPPQNTAEFYTIVRVPPGTRMRIGLAAPAFGQPGGGRQIQLLELIPPESFSDPLPLAAGP